MNGIIIRPDEPLEKALRRFIKTCEKSGVLSELKAYRHYEKPSEEKKRKNNAAKRRRMRDLRTEPKNYERRTNRKR